MTNLGSVVVVAVNVVFAVCLDRRDEFLKVLDHQVNIQNHKNDHRSSGARHHVLSKDPRQPPTLIQAAVGEDLKTPGLFHCHLKYEFSSIKDAQATVQHTRNDKDQPARSSKSDIDNKASDFSSLFLNGASEEWIDFERSNPFLLDTGHCNGVEWHMWIVAPTPTTPSSSSPTESMMHNPKLSLRKNMSAPANQQSQQQQLFCLNANLYVQPQHRQALLALLEDARRCSIQEPLCVEYQYGESVTRPNTFHVHQAYMGSGGGKEGFDLHAKTLHYQRWKEFAATDSNGDNDDSRDNKDRDNGPFTQAPIGYQFRTQVVSDSEDGSSSNQMSSSESESLCSETTRFLDGGIGHELKQRGIIADDGSFLAGMLANEKQSDIVKEVHAAFCQSGCDILTTNSFVAVPLRVQQEFSHDSEGANDKNAYGVPIKEKTMKRTRELIRAAVKCAQDVATNENERRQCDGRELVKVAGTVPPLTECYIASAVPQQIDLLVASYSFILSTLVAEGVDMLLGETLSTAREAIAIIRALSEVRTKKQIQSCIPLLISFTVDDFIQPTALRSGMLLETAVDDILEEAEIRGVNVCGIGVNCASPTAVSSAIPVLVKCLQRRRRLVSTTNIMAYANAFKTTTTEWLLTSGKIECLGQQNECLQNRALCSDDDYDQNGLMRPEAYAKYALQWKILGASIIGGCCGCSPRHMRAVTDKLASRVKLDRDSVG